MAKAVRFHTTGGPEVLSVEEVEVGTPGRGEVRIRHAAVGCNFADTYFRSGYYPVQPPSGIGVEGAGTIEAVGEGVSHVAVGDRVSYNGGPLGAYARLVFKAQSTSRANGQCSPSTLYHERERWLAPN